MSVNSLNDIWQAVLGVLGQNLTDTAISTWFEDCEPVEIDGSTLVLKTSSDFKRDIIVKRFAETIKNAMSDIFSTEFTVKVLTEDELGDYEERKADNDPLPEMAGYTFDRFIVGNSNKFAHNAAVAVAHKPGSAYNPLFIYGNSGLGKTHLLLAIGQYIRENNPGAKIAYIKGDEFTNQLLKSIKEGTGEEFRMKYRNVDLFLVDDIQFIAGKQATQEEFFHTFNALTQDGKQIVLSSDRPPKDMPQLEDRMRTRFEWGLLADVQPPDLETRMLIVKRKADALNFDISDDVIEYIAQKLKNNIRQLESAVKKMQAYVQIQGANVNTATAQQAIRDILSDNKPIPVVVDKIITEVARTYGANPEDLRSKKKDAQTSKYRQISMYIVREVTGLSAKAIGAEFGGRHYSTVLYALDEIKKESDTDSTLRTTINDIIKNVQEN